MGEREGRRQAEDGQGKLEGKVEKTREGRNKREEGRGRMGKKEEWKTERRMGKGPEMRGGPGKEQGGAG